MLSSFRPRQIAATVTAWRRASFIGIVVAGVIVVAVIALAEKEFRDAFGSNFLATVAGVALGLPVAVWLTLEEAVVQGKAARAQEEARSAARRSGVLMAIRRELTENKDTLAERRASGTREFFVPFLQDEVWAAMSDGGELRWVNDPDVLRQMARSYLFIRTIIFLERQVFEIKHYPGMRIQGNNPEGAIVTYLDHLDRVCTDAINEGCAAIERVLGAA